jgi:hypothetical protein
MIRAVIADDIGPADGTINAIHDSTITSQINGFYIIELPNNFDYSTVPSTVENLITAKDNAYLAANPSFSNAKSTEFLSYYEWPSIVNSDMIYYGDNKLTGIETGGQLTTIGVVVPATTDYFIHLDLFRIYSIKDTSTTNPSLIKKYYNFDGTTAQEITASTAVTVELDDGGGSGFQFISLDTSFPAPSGGSRTQAKLRITPTGAGLMVSSITILTV